MLSDYGLEAGPWGLVGAPEQNGVATTPLHAWDSFLLPGAHAHVCHLPQR